MGKMIRLLAAVLCGSYLCSYALGIPVSNFSQSITVENCGISVVPPSSPDRIVGGKDTEAGQYPWMVSMHERIHGVFMHVCGGSILNENWIITAAHCFTDGRETNPSKYFNLLVGLHKLSEHDDESVQLVKISNVILHEGYSEDIYEHDIALLKTAKPIDIVGSKGYVNGICLPKIRRDPAGYAKAIGWGHLYEGGQNTDTLKEVLLPIVSRRKCNEAYHMYRVGDEDRIKETMVCAGVENKDTCQSDSGGPLFQTNSDGVSTLVGIVSYGVGCGDQGYPGIYTKVSSYIKWIEKVVTKYGM